MSLIPRGRWSPWAALAFFGGLLTLRAGLVKASISEDNFSSLDHYLWDVLDVWRWGGVLVVSAGGVLLAIPTSRSNGRWRRMGWALASWSAFVAFVPPREGNFWANGGVDDNLIVYLPVALLTVACAWDLSSSDRCAGFIQLAIGVAIVAAAGAPLFCLQGGYGLGKVVTEAMLTSLVA